jgi:ribonuclease HII
MLIAGVDEAGRGPVLGPLVVAGVMFDEKDLPKLEELGVKDSKRLSSQKREALYPQIKELAIIYHTVWLSPAEIDRVVESKRRLHKLNRLEAQAMAKVVTVLKPDTVYVDASDIIPERFAEHIAENLAFTPQIVCEHKADANYPIVSAASIIAKVERDRAILKLQQKHGNMGSVYPSDPNTTKFLKNWIKKFGDYPDFVRKSWKTAKRIVNEADSKQKRLQ